LKAISALVLEDINSSNGSKVGGIASARKPVAPATPSVKPAADAAPAPSLGAMPDREPAKVLRPAGSAARPQVAAAAAQKAAPTAGGATSTIAIAPPPPARPETVVAPLPVAATAPVAPREAPRAAARAAMSDSRAALKNEVRQAAASPRRASESSGVPNPTPSTTAASSKMFLFMALGIIAGAAAAVVAAKFLLGF
jgi:hypothetical protein